jgi:amino acid transporter
MSKDHLLPEIFSQIDRHGNLSHGIIISGIICTIIAIFIPFIYLNDVISAGVLFSFNLTNSSLIIIRRGDLHSPSYTSRNNNNNNNNNRMLGNNNILVYRPICSTFLALFHLVAIIFSTCMVSVSVCHYIN